VTLLQVDNASRGTSLGGRIELAASYLARLRGLLGRPPLLAGEGLLIAPSRGIHMYGMRFPLDVVFLSESGAVVALHAGLRPWRRTAYVRAARYALELPVGSIGASRTEVGDQVIWAPVRAAAPTAAPVREAEGAG
jgi:uncharacterized protein